MHTRTFCLQDPYTPIVQSPTGWNINDVRFAYDLASDTGYFGELKLPLIV